VGFAPNNAVASATADQRLKYFGTVRGRLGYLVTSPLLVYATAGLAYGGVNSSTALSDIFVPGAFVFTPGAGSVTTTRVGWTVGGGLEYLLAGNWSLKAEYLYYDLGSTSYALTPVVVTVGGVTATNLGVTSNTADFRGSIVRAGLNYKFM
jgi:outer membrane immunogenic protein